MLVSKGAVEAVVHETFDVEHRYHPMGTTIASIAGIRSQSRTRERRPYIAMLGCGSVLGASQFLMGFGNMEYRARTQVEVLVLHHARGFAMLDVPPEMDNSIERREEPPLLPLLSPGRKLMRSFTIGTHKRPTTPADKPELVRRSAEFQRNGESLRDSHK